MISGCFIVLIFGSGAIAFYVIACYLNKRFDECVKRRQYSVECSICDTKEIFDCIPLEFICRSCWNIKIESDCVQECIDKSFDREHFK